MSLYELIDVYSGEDLGDSCSACGADISYESKSIRGDKIYHHKSYDPEEVVTVCEYCHYKIHNDDEYMPELTPKLKRREAEDRGLINFNYSVYEVKTNRAKKVTTLIRDKELIDWINELENRGINIDEIISESISLSKWFIEDMSDKEIEFMDRGIKEGRFKDEYHFFSQAIECLMYEDIEKLI